jgi:toxin ParE1/3/4
MALRFAEALNSAYRSIADRPGSGSPLHGDALGIAGLRARKVPRFPYLIFYIESGEAIEVVRILHAQRDIPAALRRR